MFLTVQQAQSIVEEIGTIVKQNINMMDEHGYIIASTDFSRIGNFHPGAKRIIDEQLPELYIAQDDIQAKMRSGINLPIAYNDEPIGVIGITGTYEQVIGYGQVVKKMTEILLREQIKEDEKRLDMRVQSRFLEEWILGSGILQPSLLAEHGRSIGIDITLPRRIMVVGLSQIENYIDSLAGQKLLEQIESQVAWEIHAQTDALILRHSARQIILLHKQNDEQLTKLALGLSAKISCHFQKELCIGIDGSSSQIRESCQQATKAWRAAKSHNQSCVLYKQLDFELFSGELSVEVKLAFINKLFYDYTAIEREQTMNLLAAYFAADGSLQKTADQLFIHKNTLQYKLHKLAKNTGYDVRRPCHAAVLYAALRFWQEINKIDIFYNMSRRT